MSATDVMLAELQGEAQQQNDFIDALVEGARKEDRDLNANERELLKRHRTALEGINEQLTDMRETARIANDSREVRAQINNDRQAPLRDRRPHRWPGRGRVPVRRRLSSIDRWQAGLGHEEARERLAMFHRAADHQTTADNLGCASRRPSSDRSSTTSTPPGRSCPRSGRCRCRAAGSSGPGHPAHRGRRPISGEGRARLAEDADHRGRGGDGHLRRLRERLPAEPGLVGPVDHGHRRQRSRRRSMPSRPSR